MSLKYIASSGTNCRHYSGKSIDNAGEGSFTGGGDPGVRPPPPLYPPYITAGSGGLDGGFEPGEKFLLVS